ncbi:hypothetical protein BPC006_II1867 [Burkholderia pseudomallei BPC006]|nr:hypothetical protein BPC006_II1867 [Burkholderia pseudomallei BPC006]
MRQVARQYQSIDKIVTMIICNQKTVDSIPKIKKQGLCNRFHTDWPPFGWHLDIIL